MLASIITLLPYELATLETAAEGLAIAIGWAIATMLVEFLLPPTIVLTRSLLVTLYSLPPLATVVVTLALGLDTEALPFIVAAAISFPMTVMCTTALAAGENLGSSVRCGGVLQRLRLITLPGASVGIILALATCLPWLLLATMLAEIATSTSGGIGLRFLNAVQNGWRACSPHVLIVSVTSIGSYLILLGVAYFVSRRLHLTKRSLTGIQSSLDAYRSPIAESVAMSVCVGVLWWVVHQASPDYAQSPSRIIGIFIKGGGEQFLDAAILTVLVVITCLAVGGVIGFGLALAAKAFKSAQSVALMIVFPLQIVPIMAFIPSLITLQLYLQDTLWADPYRPPSGLIGMLPFLVPSLAVGGLAAAYAFYDVGKSRLWLRPVARGGMLEARNRANIQIIHHVDLPWLAHAFREACDLAMPRTLLAVLITENLVTAHGLGGQLDYFKSRSAYGATWTILILSLAVVILLRFITNPKLRVRLPAFRRIS